MHDRSTTVKWRSERWANSRQHKKKRRDVKETKTDVNNKNSNRNTHNHKKPTQNEQLHRVSANQKLVAVIENATKRKKKEGERNEKKENNRKKRHDCHLQPHRTMPATASTAEDRDTFEFEPLDLNLESSDPIDMDGSGLLKFFDVFEPIHMDYDDSDAASSSADAAACTAADHNWNNSMTSVIKPGLTKQKADSVIRLRFSEMTQDTEQILQGIMDDAEILMAVDEDEAAEGQGNAAAAVPPPRASITLTNIVEAPETATGTTEHLSNNNPVISDTDDEEPIPFAYNTGDPHGGGRRRSSIMSIRPSLLSPELADKLLAGIMEIDTQVLQANTATEKKKTTTTPNPGAFVSESTASSRPQKKKRSTTTRFSMTATNPHEFFGPGKFRT